MSRAVSWDDYYQRVDGRPPRQLLWDALGLFAKDASPSTLFAIDLGCGDGTETVALLERGWNVLAIDGEPAAIRRLMGKVSPESKGRLRMQVAKFRQVALEPADLIHASLSLPFCEPQYFPVLWDKIASAINRGGRFAGHFFGPHDSWAANTDMTFLTEAQVRALFVDFQIETFHELDEDGQAASGPKHWHMFTVIAKKTSL